MANLKSEQKSNLWHFVRFAELRYRERANEVTHLLSSCNGLFHQPLKWRSYNNKCKCKKSLELERKSLLFFYQNFSLFSDYINLQNQMNYYQFQKSTVHSLKINKYPQIIYFWWFKMLCILGQLDKCGWNPSPGFDEVQSGVDISSWVKQQQFFQLGHFKRKSNLIISILNWLMQFHITQYYS